ncbi:MAG: hypothetical protein ACRC0L_07175, partial [Angustibacter sp.]
LDQSASAVDTFTRICAMGIPIAVPFGARMATMDLRSGALAQVLLRRPARGQWLLAEVGSVVVLALLSFGVFLLGAALATALWALVTGTGFPTGELPGAFLTASRGLLLAGIFAGCGALAGIAWGTDMPIIVGWLLWYFVIEIIVAGQIPGSERFLPGGWVNSVIGISPDGSALSAFGATLVLLLALAGPAQWALDRRDLCD